MKIDELENDRSKIPMIKVKTDSGWKWIESNWDFVDYLKTDYSTNRKKYKDLSDRLLD